MAITIRSAATVPWIALQDTQLLALYQRMAKLRKAHQALRYGGCQVIYAEDNVVVFVRVYKQQRVLVAITAGKPARWLSKIPRC
mgnify:CR=1 FL=1